jgi:hypothetical protein
MRIGISVAAVVLLTLVAVACFVPDLKRFWPFSGNPSAETAEQKEADARKELAFASLTERLPKGKSIPPVKALDAEAKKRWEILDQTLGYFQDGRAELLKALHEKTRKFFVESPGAGPSRMVLTPETILLDSRQGMADPPQPGAPPDFPVSAGETLDLIRPGSELYSHHERGLINFLYPSGFGYIKDREHVAGFKPHGFRFLGVPESDRWRIHHVQLVGILSHEEPVVYLTDKLPSMEQVRQGKTRALDYFEEAALPSLRDGEDLYVVSKDDTLRMLGALRATKTCQKCHDAEIGDLLGAFSYTLRPASKEKKTSADEGEAPMRRR